MHDPARRRRARRTGREKGCWVYVPAETLEAQRIPTDAQVYYRTWGDPKRPRVMVNLYREP